MLVRILVLNTGVMKKLLLFCFISSFFQISAFSQSCLPEGITFETQDQIDSFQVDYPGCTTIGGNVYIFNTDITDLDGISMLDSILGSLIFEDNELLVDMTGLNNLHYIGGDLLIYYNPALTSLTGLENLQIIGGSLDIEANFALSSLAGLENLQTIGENLEIQMNHILSSLAGLENLSAASINDISIYYNSNLSDCDIQGICDYLTAPKGQVEIYKNATGCNNPPEIAQSCGTTLTCLPFGNYHFSSQQEIDGFPSDYSHCNHLAGYVSISGENIMNLDSLSVLDTINGYLFICGNDNLSSLNGLNNLKTIQDGLIIGGIECNGNNALTNMEGLNGLTSVGESVFIDGNANILTLSGLDSLSSIGSSLRISYNMSLKNLHGLESLISAGGFNIEGNYSLLNLNALLNLINVENISIQNNPVLLSIIGIENINADFINSLNISDNDILSICDVRSVCDYLAVYGADVEIYNNAPGCNSQEEVELVCGVGVVEVGSRQSIVVSYPNPFSSQTTFNIRLENSARVNLKVFNNLGQAVATILDDPLEKGENQVMWDPEGLAPGIFFYRVSIDGQPLTGKLVIVK